MTVLRRPLGLGLALLLAACVVTPPSPRPTAAPVPPAELENEILTLINQHRAQLHLAPFTADTRIADLARQHSQAMASGARPFGHEGFDQRATTIASLLPAREVAENVAYNSTTGSRLAGAMVSGWLASREHRENIEGAYDLTGIGVVTSRTGVTYATEIFVRQ